MPALPQLSTTLHSLATRSLTRRHLSSGASAGIGIAVAVVGLALIGAVVYFLVQRRRNGHLAEIEHERAKYAGELKQKKEAEAEKPKPKPTGVKRNKSIKDRLKGPLYQEAYEMPPRVPGQEGEEGVEPGSPHWDEVDGQPLTHKPWAKESSPRPSFSSKRGTRMMMMM